MKKIIFLLILVVMSTCSNKSTDNSNTSDDEAPPPLQDAVRNSNVTPSELAQTVVQILAAIRTDLTSSDLPFSKAELTISAKQTLEGSVKAGGELFVKLEGEIAASAETSVDVSYELSEPIQEVLEIKKLKMVKGQFQLQPDKTFWMNQIPHSGKLKKRIDPLSDDEAKRVLDSVKTSVTKKQDSVKNQFVNENLKNAFVLAIRNAIEENKEIKKNFDKTCIAVEIGFTIGKKASGSVGFEILGAEVSASVSGAKEGTHTLKLSFGGC